MNTRSSRIFAALLCAFVLAIVIAPAPARASSLDQALAPQLVATLDVSSLVAAPVLAQVEPTAVAPATPWYSNSTVWTSVFALIAGVVAVLQNKSKTTAQKINETLILGIEAASKIPEVVAAEKKLKAAIKQKATDAGVQPVLDRLVQGLTS